MTALLPHSHGVFAKRIMHLAAPERLEQAHGARFEQPAAGEVATSRQPGHRDGDLGHYAEEPPGPPGAKRPGEG